jgi:arylsulfatase A-like enzyme
MDRMSAGRLEAIGLFLAAAACGACSRASEAPPNVLLISLDTLRADHLSAYGYERETSPHIDALAAAGVLFEEAVSTTSWTLPAHLSLFTGLSVSGHGICDERLWQPDVSGSAELPLRGTQLAELLRGAGYATAGFYTWKYLEPRFGLGAGFDVYERLGLSVFSHPEWSKRFEELRKAGKSDEIRAWMAESPELFDEQRPTAREAVDRALAWLDQRPAERPFFLFVHLFDIHDDYVPPAPFDARFTDPGYQGPINGRNVTSPDSPVHAGMEARDLAQLIALYDGEIAWVDSQVGRILERLEELGLREDTLVVLTSDHGEEFFEHGGKTHRAQLYKESVHVPLILSWPGSLPAGRRVDGPAGIVDVLPTVTALCGVRTPENLSGRDLAAVARGEVANAPQDYVTELVVFPPGAASPLREVGLWGPERHMLFHFGDQGERRAEWFDRAADPAERGAGRPVAAESAEALEFAQRLERARTRLWSERRAAPQRAEAVLPLGEEELSELEKMGYAGAGHPGGRAAASTSPGVERLCLDGCVWPDR